MCRDVDCGIYICEIYKKYGVSYLNVECVECGKFYIYICSLAKCR